MTVFIFQWEHKWPPAPGAETIPGPAKLDLSIGNEGNKYRPHDYSKCAYSDSERRTIWIRFWGSYGLIVDRDLFMQVSQAFSTTRPILPIYPSSDNNNATVQKDKHCPGNEYARAIYLTPGPRPDLDKEGTNQNGPRNQRCSHGAQVVTVEIPHPTSTSTRAAINVYPHIIAITAISLDRLNETNP